MVGGGQVEADEFQLADRWLVPAGSGPRQANDPLIDHRDSRLARIWAGQASRSLMG